MPDINELTSSEELQAAADRACERCRTKIIIDNSDGREIIRPLIADTELRRKSILDYDNCISILRKRDKMYMPPAIERSVPAKERLRFLMEQFLGEQSARAMHSQNEGRSYNRLFGSRG
ncbi:MAG: hypothetical protein ACOX75_01655 [Lachnospiraceae bacterium]|jgi:hypothetical protein